MGQHVDSLYDVAFGNQEITSAGIKNHLNLWRTSCRPWVQKFPELNKLKAAYYESKIQFIAISKEPKIKTDRIIKDNQLDFKLLFDGLVFLEALDIKQSPISLLINEKGILEQHKIGIIMKGVIVNGKSIMNMHNLSYYKLILSKCTNLSFHWPQSKFHLIWHSNKPY